MFKIILIGSLLLGGEAATQTNTEPSWLRNETDHEVSVSYYYNDPDLDDIVYVKEEEEIELGFDTKKYLPEGFDPYIGSLDNIEYIDPDEAEEIDLGFDTKSYLPEKFDPYALDLKSIKYIKMEDEGPLFLDIDTDKRCTSVSNH